jgi:hypothetical protein
MPRLALPHLCLGVGVECWDRRTPPCCGMLIDANLGVRHNYPQERPT